MNVFHIITVRSYPNAGSSDIDEVLTLCGRNWLATAGPGIEIGGAMSDFIRKYMRQKMSLCEACKLELLLRLYELTELAVIA